MEDADVVETEGTEVIDVAAKEGVFRWPFDSIELSEGACMDWDFLASMLRSARGAVSASVGGVESNFSEETPLVMMSKVVLVFCGALIPRSRALCRKTLSTSSSD